MTAASLLWGILLLFSFFPPHNVNAMPASPDMFDLTQDDGNTLKGRLVGDEWENRTETVEGYSVAKKRGFWYFVDHFKNGQAVLSKTKAHAKVPRGLKKHLRRAKKFHRLKKNPYAASFSASTSPLQSNSSPPSFTPTSGQSATPVLFILAGFADQAGYYMEADFGSFLTNGIADYYAKASYGKVSILPANESSGIVNNGVTDWLDLGYNHPNPGSNTGIDNQLITKNAIIAADQYVDYASYDSNNDGYVDSNELAIVVVVAGWERAFSSNYTPSVWGHRWSLWSSQVASPLVDGVRVADYHNGAGGYAQFGEIQQSSTSNGHQATLGIMVHELGHLLFGLPDLYDTDGSSSGIGAFGVMSSGSWGKAASDQYSGQTPVLPCAWTKLKMSWASPSTASSSFQVTASGSSGATEFNTVYKLTSSDNNQFFLVENRQPLGYDKGLERYLGNNFGGGISIWHIDESIPDNSDDFHRMVDLEEADGTIMAKLNGSNSDLWYLGNSGIFDSSSSPDSRLYNGLASNVCLNTPLSSTVMRAASGCPNPLLSYIISAGTGSGGVISPQGDITLPAGTSQTFSITANTGSYLSQLIIDGSSIGTVNSYTFTNIAADHTIWADFALLDHDGDGIPDIIDNCPGISNTNQLDGNNDGVGDFCEILLGDFDFDGDVDGLDLESFSFAYLNLDPNADLDSSGTIEPSDADLFAGQYGAPYITLEISANGVSHELGVTAGTPLDLEFLIRAGTRNNLVSDWWLTAQTPNGPLYLAPTGWQVGENLYSQKAATATTIPESSIFNQTTTPGTYIFTFGIDKNADGLKDETWNASVTVTVM